MRVLLWAAMWCASAGLWACDPAHPCETGYYSDHGACLRVPTVNAADADVDADGGMGGPPAYNADDFGLACDDSADCHGSAPVCGAPMFPICTQVNCLGKPSVCPKDWMCLDVSSVSPDPSVTSACINF